VFWSSILHWCHTSQGSRPVSIWWLTDASRLQRVPENKSNRQILSWIRILLYPLLFSTPRNTFLGINLKSSKQLNCFWVFHSKSFNLVIISPSARVLMLCHWSQLNLPVYFCTFIILIWFGFSTSTTKTRHPCKYIKHIVELLLYDFLWISIQWWLNKNTKLTISDLFFVTLT